MRTISSSRLSPVAAVLLSLAACQSPSGARGPADPGIEVVPAAPAAEHPDTVIHGRFWVEASPMEGRMTIFRLHPGNVIHRNEPLAIGAAYDIGCVVGVDCPAGTLTMSTDQDTVSYVQDGFCYHNGQVDTVADCIAGGVITLDVCAEDRTFCGEVQALWNGADPLSNPILDVANPIGLQEPPVTGCVNDAADGNASGLCATSAPDKINPDKSTFVPAIAGGAAAGLEACAYCYGNAATATSLALPGLRDALLPGSSPTVAQINTTTLALRIGSSSSFDVSLTMYGATPRLGLASAQIALADANGGALACVPAGGARVLVRGGGFGLPDECGQGDPPASCPVVGTPTAGTAMSVAGVASPALDQWSDTEARTTVMSGIYGCGVTLTTPSGELTTSDEIPVCGDVWRGFTSAGAPTAQKGAGGVVGDWLVQAGGMTGSAPGTSSNAIRLTPLPRCADTAPATTVAATTLPAGAGTWGQAATVNGNGQLVVVGGAVGGTTCSNSAFLIMTDGNDATITALPDLPDTDPVAAGTQGLCQATALALVDQMDGKEYVIVTGGLVGAPWPSAGAAAPAVNARTYVYDPEFDYWITYNYGIERYDAAGAGYTGSSAVEHKGVVVGGVADTASETAAATTDVTVVTISDGQPDFVAGPALPAARAAAAVVVHGGTFWVHGGATTAAHDASGTSTLYALAAEPLGTDFTAKASADAPRAGHVLAVGAYAEPTYSTIPRFLAAYGFGAASPATTVDEYNP
jgi:hypothetical protein